VGTLFLILLGLAQAAPPSRFSQLIGSATDHIREKRLDAAITELSQAAALQPRSATVHLLLGQAYLGKGTPELVAQAKAEFQEARDLDLSKFCRAFT
jgi:Flp pilus assembly protein TadD